MKLSRKRQRELNKLKREASELWDDQKEVLDHATKVVKGARKQLAQVSREEVAPRVRDIYESRVQPGLDAGRSFAENAKDKVTKDVLPAVSSALGTALAALEVARSPKVREALGRVARSAAKPVEVAKPRGGAGRYIMIGVGVLAAAGIAYAAWQILRADDELWVSDEADAGAIE